MAVALNVPCSTLLPGGLAAACLQAIGAVDANCVVVVVGVTAAAATFIAIDEAGDDVEDDEVDDFVESVRADVLNALMSGSDSFSSSGW